MTLALTRGARDDFDSSMIAQLYAAAKLPLFAVPPVSVPSVDVDNDVDIGAAAPKLDKEAPNVDVPHPVALPKTHKVTNISAVLGDNGARGIAFYLVNGTSPDVFEHQYYGKSVGAEPFAARYRLAWIDPLDDKEVQPQNVQPLNMRGTPCKPFNCDAGTRPLVAKNVELNAFGVLTRASVRRIAEGLPKSYADLVPSFVWEDEEPSDSEPEERQPKPKKQKPKVEHYGDHFVQQATKLHAIKGRALRSKAKP